MVIHIRALLIVSLGCVVFGAPALSPYAPGRSNPSGIHQKSTNCHPKGRSRISAHVAPHVCDDGIVVIDPPPRKRVQANPWLPIEPASSSPRPWPSLTCISGQSRLLPQQRGRPPAAGPVRKGHHRPPGSPQYPLDPRVGAHRAIFRRRGSLLSHCRRACGPGPNQDRRGEWQSHGSG